MPEPQPEQHVIVIDKDISDENLKAWMQILHPIIVNAQRQATAKVIATLDGFGSDPRELYDIPEAVELCKRLVALGFISLLEVTTLAEPVKSQFPLGGWGALEIWLTATGQFSGGAADMTPTLWETFFKELEASNDRCSKITNQT